VKTPEVLSYANELFPLVVVPVVTLKSVKLTVLDKSAGANVNTPVPESYANDPPPLALVVVVLTKPLTSLSAGPVYVITPVPESYAALPNPPASVTLIWALVSAALGPV